MVLADTSAWIEYERGTGSPVHLRLAELIGSDGPIAVTEPVIMEVLAGPADLQREARWRALFNRFRLLPFLATIDFDGAVGIYRRCRGKGATPGGMLDCMIASVAWRHDATLLCRDAQLAEMARLIGVELDPASLQA